MSSCVGLAPSIGVYVLRQWSNIEEPGLRAEPKGDSVFIQYLIFLPIIDGRLSWPEVSEGRYQWLALQLWNRE